MMSTFLLSVHYVSWGLLTMISKMKNALQLKGLCINKYAPSITHLMFVDDLLLFGITNRYTNTKIKEILDIYKKWFG